jgi:hypothetical protein
VARQAVARIVHDVPAEEPTPTESQVDDEEPGEAEAGTENDGRGAH